MVGLGALVAGGARAQSDVPAPAAQPAPVTERGNGGNGGTSPLPPELAQPLDLLIAPNLPPEQRPVVRQALQRQVEATPRRGFLFEAVRGPRRIFLYGATEWSLPDPVYFPINRPLLQSLAASAALLTLVDLEQKPPARDEVLRLGTYAEGDSLDKNLNPSLLARLNLRLQGVGQDLSSVSRYKPWLVADMVSSQKLLQNGWRKPFSSENVLVSLAHGMNKPIYVVETWPQWAQALEGMNPALQQGQLSLALRDTEGTHQQDRMQQLLEIWMAGDQPRLERHVAELGAQADQLTQAADGRAAAWASYRQQAFFKQRNQRVLDVMELLTAGPAAPPLMVSVPLQYLAGADGLLVQLQARDYSLKDLQAP